MKKIFEVFGRTVSAALFAYGIFQLPKDIQDTPESARPWQKFIAMFDQNTLLWTLVVILILSVFWSDLRPVYRLWRERRRKSPLEVSVSIDTFEWEKVGSQVYTIGLFEIKNLSDVPLEGLEVHLLGILTPNRGYRAIRRKLYPEGSIENRFDALPGQGIRIKIFRYELLIPEGELEIGSEIESRSEIGPFNDNEYVEISPNGTCKLEVAIYGRNIKPMYESFGVSLNGNSYSVGRWKDDFKPHLRASSRVRPSTEVETQP
jgi:hypothetical protein